MLTTSSVGMMKDLFFSLSVVVFMSLTPVSEFFDTVFGTGLDETDLSLFTSSQSKQERISV